MKNKKNNRLIMGFVIVILVLIGIMYYIFNYTKDDNSLSIVEKKWITDNINNIIDINVYNDIPIYGYNGSGIVFDFLDSFTKQYNINFNKISYYLTDSPEYKDISFRILDSTEEVSDNEILFYKDDYVVLSSKEDSLSELDSIDNIGIISTDKEIIINYFDKNISYKDYEKITDLFKALSNGEVNYAIVPNVMYMNEILGNDLNIIYHIDDLSKKYVLNIKDKTVYNIMKKYYTTYLNNNYQENYSKEFLALYFKSTNTEDIKTKNYNAKIYKYGYVVNMPYENYSSSNFVGTISNYLNDFESVANVEIEVVRYDTVDELKNALVSGEVDFALTNFEYDTINMKNITTLAFSDEHYVVLSKDNIALTKIKGLEHYKVSVVGSSNLYNLCVKNNIKTNNYSDTNDLIRNVNTDDIILIDKYTYEYYKNEKLSNYKVVYEDKINNGYKFIINSENDTFASLLNYYVSSKNYNEIRYKFNTNIMLEEDNNNLKIAIFILVIIVGTIIYFLTITRKKNHILTLNKEDKLKYIDLMTSLKNRNYLNNNIYTWDENVIFPQSVVILNINNLREINDKYGREVGDEVIKKVASILINNQLENTDIIRSGGDEFLIYMIGYDEKKVVEYAKKMVKEMKNIPNSSGVEMGYSMIMDEVKTVDDAINESITMLVKNKEKKI